VKQDARKDLLRLSPQSVLSCLLEASGKQTKDQISEANRYREIGFEGENARLGWVTPPTWLNIERILNEFMCLQVAKHKKHYIFSGMGGSINAVKALIQILGDQSRFKLYTIDSLDPTALEELFSSIGDLSKALVIGVSKSGTTKETQDLLKALREGFYSQNLDYRNHFLWLTDLPQGKQNMEDVGWQGVETLSIQTDGGTDIGGRFSAPHTLVFLIPLLLLLDQDLHRLKAIWSAYLSLREKLILESAKKAYELAKKETQHFAIVLEEKLVQALETRIIQLFQESLGSKIAGFNPKTIVAASGTMPEGFEEVMLETDTATIIVDAMLSMFLLQVFVAIFAYYKGINFVTQPEVERYKRKMTEILFQKTSPAERVTINQLLEDVRKLLQHKPQAKFLEVICYWHLKERLRHHLKRVLKTAFPDKQIFVFVGSDWNHHSYQAASWNEDTLFIILTKRYYEQQIKGISAQTLRKNTATLKTIAYATYKTLNGKAEFFEVEENGLRSP